MAFLNKNVCFVVILSEWITKMLREILINFFALKFVLIVLRSDWTRCSHYKLQRVVTITQRLSELLHVALFAELNTAVVAFTLKL